MLDQSLASLPKVVLHDHLDGGLRPQTILDLADQSGYTALPAGDTSGLADWFDQGRSGSLEGYLESFTHTVALMQTGDAIERVCYEAVIDAAKENVIYAELRCAPSLLTRGGLRREDVIEAMLAGLARGEQDSSTVARLIVDAMRHEQDSVDVARSCLPFVGSGLVGFDLAGPEAGFPPDLHVAACQIVREANLGLTIHAGEADGPNSIWRALQRCGAHRIGHGVRIIDDCATESGEITTVGPVAAYVRDHQIPLEICPTSNLHTVGWTAAEHPVGMLHRGGFNVTISPDNRLMSQTSMTDEYLLLVENHGLVTDQLMQLTRRSIDAAFCDWETKVALHHRLGSWATPTMVN